MSSLLVADSAQLRAATLLQSSGIAYRYGVSGPFWYASGATVQILLFATLAIELKRRAPNAHTFLEVIRARYGTYAHITFMVFGLLTNILYASGTHKQLLLLTDEQLVLRPCSSLAVLLSSPPSPAYTLLLRVSCSPSVSSSTPCLAASSETC